MAKFLKYFCFTAAMALGLVSCSSDLEPVDGRGDGDLVSFVSARSYRASGTQWAANDRIGVYMYTSGTDVENAGLTGASANVAYVTAAGDGHFVAASTPLRYPSDGSKVDFIAYYPYTSTVTNGVVAVNIANQSKPETIDLLYANNLKGLDKTAGTGTLAFSHQLAQVVLELQSADGLPLDGMTATVEDVPTVAGFRLSDATFTGLSATSDVKMTVTGQGTALQAKAMLIPNASLAGGKTPLCVTLTTADGKAQQVTLPEVKELVKGGTHVVTLRVKNSGGQQGGETVKYTRWTETPTITAEQLNNTRLKYVTHYFEDGTKRVRNYSMLYDADMKFSYWVAYPLCNYYTKKNTDRTDAWAYDPQVPETDQPNLFKSYRGNYDRGHQIPSADRLVTVHANEQTFYYTNMTPQVGALNQKVWAKLEDKIRSWSSNIDTLFVVTGALPSAPGSADLTYTYDNEGRRVVVPAYYFKALAKIDRQTGNAYTIAFKFDNASFPGGEEGYMQAAMSVKELEDLTGFHFFPSINAAYKQAYDAVKWQ